MNELLTKDIEHTKFKDSELGRIPEGWELKPLSALAEYHNGRAFKPEDWSRKGLPIVRIAQINDPFRETDYYEGTDVLDKHLIEKGDLIFSWSATLKAILWKEYDAVLNQHLFKVIEKSNISRIYLQQLLEFSIEKLAESSHGSTMKHIKKGVLDTFHCVVPPLPEQKKIASILTSVDEVIENTQKQIDKLQDLKKATMNELLTKGIEHTKFKDSELGRIPEEWHVVELGDIFTLTSGKAKPTKLLSSHPTMSRSIAVYGGNGVTGYTDHPLLEQKTVVIGRVGEYCGCVHMSEKKSWISDNALYVKKITGKVMLSFLYELLIFSDLSKFRSKGGQPLINQPSIYALKVAIPNEEEQKKIFQSIDSIKQSIKTHSEKFHQTQSLKKSLMQDLLTGKVRVKEAHDVR